MKDLSTDIDIGLANARLHSLLLAVLEEEALVVAGNNPGQGLEVWRQLNVRFDLSGGQWEMDRMIQLMERPPCKNVSELPLQRNIRTHEARSSEIFPET